MAIALVIDLGTTNLKVGLVDDDANIICVRSVGVNVKHKKSGGAGHDPEELKKLIIGLCRDLLAESKIIEVQYIVSSTYQFGLMLLDAQRKPLTGMTLLTDIRSQQTFNEFINAYSDIDIYSRTGCPLMTPYQLPRLFYFSTREKELFQKAKFFTDSKSFLFEWLTGEFVTDMSTAAATQHYNLHTYSWDSELLSRVGLTANQFPKVEDGTTYTGTLTEELRIALGFTNKVTVLLGLYDGAALAVGLGSLQPQIGIINVGTSAMLRVPSEIPVFDKDDNKRIQAYALRKNLFLNGGALNNAALPLNWLRKSLFDVDLQDSKMLKIGKQPPLICLPYLTSERDSKTGPYASGVFFGLRQYHTKAHLAKAMLEGVAYSMRYIYDALKENQLPVSELRMGGGGAQIKPWPQIFSNILGLAITIPAGPQMALVGSAALAFVADGLYKDINAVSEKITKGESIQPDEKVVEIHDERYLFYKKLRETVSPLYKEHSKLALQKVDQHTG